MGLGANKMVKLFSFLFITVFFISNGRSQKLYIPVSNEEIIKIYKLGKKSSSGEYVYTDKDGNIRIKGKFHKNIPFGKWYLFYKNGALMANYGYNDNGELLVVGKLGQPIKMSEETDTTFILRYDT